MNCKKVRKNLSCYLDNELKERKRKKISEHMVYCPSCQKEFVLLSHQDKLLGKLLTLEPAENFYPRLLEKIQQLPTGEEKPFLLPTLWKELTQIIPLPRPVLVSVVLFLGVVSGFLLFALRSPGLKTNVEQEYFLSLGIKSFADISPNSIEEVVLK